MIAHFSHEHVSIPGFVVYVTDNRPRAAKKKKKRRSGRWSSRFWPRLRWLPFPSRPDGSAVWAVCVWGASVKMASSLVDEGGLLTHSVHCRCLRFLLLMTINSSQLVHFNPNGGHVVFLQTWMTETFLLVHLWETLKLVSHSAASVSERRDCFCFCFVFVSVR